MRYDREMADTRRHADIETTVTVPGDACLHTGYRVVDDGPVLALLNAVKAKIGDAAWAAVEPEMLAIVRYIYAS